VPTIRLTPAEAAALERRPGVVVGRPAAPVPRARGRSQRHTPGVQNQLEARYEREVLIPAKLSGGVVDYWFEAITLKLADGARYTPDYLVLDSDLVVELVDTKARWSNGQIAREDALLKMKFAAQRFPLFRFVAAVWDTKAGWSRKEF
jgi:hypothetical protein